MMDKAETGRSTPCDNKVLCTVDCVVNSGRKFRRFEAVVKKWCCRKWAVAFNRACLCENLIPKYCQNIYICI